MILPLLLSLQSTGIAGPLVTDDQRYQSCIQKAQTDPVGAQSLAVQWRDTGGGFRAIHCLAMADAAGEQWPAAAEAFGSAAAAAATAGEAKAAADFHAQAGNAWLLAGDAAKARVALDAALEGGALTGSSLGAVRLDRARADVVLGEAEAARSDIDAGIREAPNEPMGWLLSATLARRTGDLRRARQDIAVALTKAPQEPAVFLEAGNIAAKAGEADTAKADWEKVVELAPGSDEAASAKAALAQFADAAPAD